MVDPSVGFVTWTYRFRFSLPNGSEARIIVPTGMKGIVSRLSIDDVLVASDHTLISLSDMSPMAGRQHRLETELEDGSVLHVELGYVTALKVGIRAFLHDRMIYESHPGKEIDYLTKQADKLETRNDDEGFQQGMQELRKLGSQKEKFKRNWPSLAVDVALGFIFFFVAKYTDLTTAAIWGAVAGLALVAVQQFVKNVDLLGGLALFGIVMMLISAGYAFVFQDEYLIQMRTSVMGALGAVLYLVDGLLGGKYLGERTARYLFQPDVVPRRLSIALGLLSIAMALLNWGVVQLVSKEIWLYYTTFGDFIIIVVLFSIAMKWVVVPGYDAAQTKLTGIYHKTGGDTGQ